MVEKYDIIIRNARLRGRDYKKKFDVAIYDGKIDKISEKVEGHAEVEIDAKGRLLSPAFYNMHFHLDSVLTLGKARFNESGTLWEGIAIWAEYKKNLTVDEVLERIEEYIKWSVAHGTLYIRSHADCTEKTLTAVRGLIEAREKFKDFIDIQVTAFPQDGIMTEPDNAEYLRKAVEMGADNVGMIPHNEYTREDAVESIRTAFEIAKEFDRDIDGHVDETDDPISRNLEVVAKYTLKYGWIGRVAAGHVTASHSWDPAYRYRILPLIRKAGVTVVANPLINIYLQGRFDIYPKRRGMAPIKMYLDNGINVTLGHDTVLDPWYPLGVGSMLQALFMALHVDQMMGWSDLFKALDLITYNAAKAWRKGYEEYGLEEGKRADLVLLNALTDVDALRNLEAPLYVIRRGKLVADNTGPERELKVFYKGKWETLDLYFHRAIQ
jgi:cytosine deaminase